MLEEVSRHDADVLCLQEVDHFPFLKKALNCLGYEGHFLPKPDSPCIYLSENSGPDGCAIFYKRDRFKQDAIKERILRVWHVESNQVVLAAVLTSLESNRPVLIATTHLKARNGALLSTLRNEQGKDILDFVSQCATKEEDVMGDQIPVVIAGDFNAEPSEPVYETMTKRWKLIKLIFSLKSHDIFYF